MLGYGMALSVVLNQNKSLEFLMFMCEQSLGDCIMVMGCDDILGIPFVNGSFRFAFYNPRELTSRSSIMVYLMYSGLCCAHDIHSSCLVSLFLSFGSVYNNMHIGLNHHIQSIVSSDQ